ncbi:MAG: exonuclease SbcCD subunit D [Gemmatimonadota bacterium]
MPLRMLHFADLHLGVDNHGHVDQATGLHSRLADFAATLAFVFDAAVEERVDLVLFAGDVYRNSTPSPTVQREFARQLRRLREARIPIVFIIGNHDSPAAFGRATSVDVFQALELEGTHVVRAPRLLRLVTASGPLQVAGLPWPSRHYLRTHDDYRELGMEALNARVQQICEARIAAFAAELDGTAPAVLAAHITAAEAVYSGSERTATIGHDPTLLTSALAHPAFDYVALGHLHRHQNLNPTGTPPVVYAGSVERVDFGEEADTKGFCLVDLPERPSRGAAFRFIHTPARRFVTVAVPDRDAGAGDLTEAVTAAIATADVEGAIVRVTYPAPQGGDQLDMGLVRQALRGAHCIAGIIPRQAPRPHQRRAAISEHMGLVEALDCYIANNPELAAERDALQLGAAELVGEVESGPSPGGAAP